MTAVKAKGLVLDTSILVRLERTRAPLKLERADADWPVYLSAISVSELLMGVHYAENRARRARRLAWVEYCIGRFPALPFTAEVARVHAELHAQLAKKGQLIGAHDLLIAATAVSHGCALATHNRAEFSRVPGLTLLPE